MADFPKAANGIILEEGKGGTHYPVKFNWVPRVGELIDLTAISEIKPDSKNDFRFTYEVVAVVHEMHDVTEGGDRPRNGHHSLRVIVRKTNSPHFGS